MNLNQVTIPVVNLQAACIFYRKMGFLQIVDSAEYARFESQLGEATFSLMLSNAGHNPAVIYFETEILDSKVAELQEKGFEFEQLPADQSYLWREAILHDPSGNKIKLYWAGVNRRYPPWRVELKA